MDKKTGLTVRISKGCYAIKTARKDSYLLELIKGRLTPSQRAWDPIDFVWLVQPSCLGVMTKLITDAGYDLPAIPAMTHGATSVVEKTFEIEYLGQCKEREDKTITAIGQVGGYWTIEIPEAVLKAYFHKNGNAPLITDAQTFYQILCVFESASDADLKSAYRKLALQWHPDRCSEPDAPEMFRRIDQAYKILREPQARARYDAGLYFEREAAKKVQPKPDLPTAAKRRPKFWDNPHYRAPLRCGSVTVKGQQIMNKFKVSEILRWDDAHDSAGRTMVSSWSNATKSVVIRWI